MANTSISPNMTIAVPVPTVDPGPQWATDLYNALYFTVDAHNHTPGNGAPITAGSILLSQNLPFNNNSATSLFSAAFNSMASSLGSSYVDQVYVVSNNLYFNNGTGMPVQITNGNSIVGAAGTISGLPSGTASASYNSITGTFIWQQSTNTAASMDAGSLLIRPETASANAVTLQAPAGLSAGYTLTLPTGLVGATEFLLVGATGAMSISNTVGALTVGNFTVSSSDVLTAPQITATGELDVTGPSNLTGLVTVMGNETVSGTLAVTGNATFALNHVISSSSGAFQTSSGGIDPITNLSNTITTAGNPVVIQFISDNSVGNSASLNVHRSSNGTCQSIVYVYRDSAQIFSYELQSNDVSNIFVPSSSISFVDFTASVGSHTYTAYLQNVIGTFSGCYYSKLVTYEL